MGDLAVAVGQRQPVRTVLVVAVRAAVGEKETMADVDGCGLVQNLMMEKLEAGVADEKSGEVLGEVYVPLGRMVVAETSESRREELWKLVL